MANTSELTTLITFDVALPAIRTLCKEIRISRVIVTAVTDYIKGFPVSSAKSLDLEKGWLHFAELLEKSTSTRRSKVEVQPEDPALIQFTGGTTGVPKGAVLTHGNVIAAVFYCALWGNPTISSDPAGKTQRHGGSALFSCLWKHCGHELGHVFMRNPDPGPPF